MAKREIRISNCNKVVLGNLVKQMVTVNKFVTMRIEDEKTVAIGYFPSHDVVKMYSVSNTQGLFGGIEAHEKPIRISVTNGLDILIALRNYRDNEDIDIVVYADDDEAQQASELYAFRMAFVSTRLKVELACADRNFSEKTMSPLPQDVVMRLFDTSNKNCTFAIDLDNMKSIKSLASIDKSNRVFGFVANGEGEVRICEKRADEDGDPNNEYYIYNMQVATDAQGTADKNSYLCNKNIFAIMQDTNWCVDICKNDNKIVYNSTDDNTTESVTIVGVVNDIK